MTLFGLRASTMAFIEFLRLSCDRSRSCSGRVAETAVYGHRGPGRRGRPAGLHRPHVARQRGVHPLGRHVQPAQLLAAALVGRHLAEHDLRAGAMSRTWRKVVHCATPRPRRTRPSSRTACPRAQPSPSPSAGRRAAGVGESTGEIHSVRMVGTRACRASSRGWMSRAAAAAAVRAAADRPARRRPEAADALRPPAVQRGEDPGGVGEAG